MNKDIMIRPMLLNDVDRIQEIEKLCFAVPWSREAFCMEINNNQCARYVTALVGDTIVGYGGMWLIIDEAHVTNVAVHPVYRGRKIGEAIMRELMTLALSINIQKMTLEVRKSNMVAQNLYRKLGFQVGGVRKKYYSDNNEDAFIMWNENIGSMDV